MKTFKLCMNEVAGLRFIFDELGISSGIGRKHLLNQEFTTDSLELTKELDTLEEIIKLRKDENHVKSIDFIWMKLHQINDIYNTIKNLDHGNTLDDIELFELKKFALLSQAIGNEIEKLNFSTVTIKNLEKVIDCLDPEKKKIPHFYIYSAYSEKLGELRKEIERAKTEQEAEALKWEALKIEDQIRQDLSVKLRPYGKALFNNIKNLAYLDVLLAKAEQAIEFNLCRPEISETETSYKGLYNPQLKSLMAKSKKEFQPVDITLYNAPSLITGANMSGKTVLLKTVALAQFLFQFGFYIPATQAKIMPVDDILFSIGDNQSEMSGLSSFAVEILNINKIIVSAKKGDKLLALVDELARTTNPEEGKALVSAFIQIMTEYKVNALITSHYSGIATPCRRLRVKGLDLHDVTEKIRPANISNYMDYSLIETDSDEVPMEGLTIAEIFEVDEDFLSAAKKMI